MSDFLAEKTPAHTHQRAPQFAPDVKRLVDLVQRGPPDNDLYPTHANETVFRREWDTYHNATPDIVEIGYRGPAAWGQRITIPLRQSEIGDLLSWIAIRIRPASWLGADLDAKINSGMWDYQDVSGAWMWAASLGTIAIANVELQVGDNIVEQWPGEWMDVWSRTALDAGRAGTWDADIYGQLPVWVARDVGRPPWTTISPTEDGYIYCWLPLCFFRRPKCAFPLIAIGEGMDVRLNITFRPFSQVVRRRAVPLTHPGEVPLGQTITLVDKSGPTSIPYQYTLSAIQPTFDDVTVFAGAVQLDEPLRSAYMRQPFEMLYEPVSYHYADTTNAVARQFFNSGTAVTKRDGGATVFQSIPLTSNGPVRELVFMLRRKNVWRWNEWTNYGALPDEALGRGAVVDPSGINVVRAPTQIPLLYQAQLWGGNATWENDIEKWWRCVYGLTQRGGVRGAGGMVYGYQFGLGGEEEFQPPPTFNASRADLRLDIWTTPSGPAGCEREDEYSWDIHVFMIGCNWMRFVNGLAGQLFAG